MFKYLMIISVVVFGYGVKTIYDLKFEVSSLKVQNANLVTKNRTNKKIIKQHRKALKTKNMARVKNKIITAPAKKAKTESSTGSIWTFVKQKPFAVFIFASACLQVSFGAFYGFFALYMRDLGYSGQQTGVFIALGVLAEVGMFLVARHLISRFGVWNLLFASIVLTALRWYLLADFAEFISVIVISQIIHALSFGLTTILQSE